MSHPTEEGALLAARDLRIIKSGSGDVLLNGIDLTVHPGEAVGIVGESGSGKSLTARSIIGLLPAGLEAAGEIEFAGKSLLGHRKYAESVRGTGLTMVLQDPFTSLSPLRRCGRQITDGPLLRRKSRSERRGEAVRRLAEVGIEDERVARKFPFQLSGGMRQRVALAAALASDPRLLIADEFSTALDATTQRDVLLLLDRIRAERRMALVMITHDLRMAFSICDRVYVLYAGALVEVGTALEVERDPMHPYTQGLLLSEPTSDTSARQLYEMPGRVPAANDVLNRCPFADRCDFAEEICSSSLPALRDVEGRTTACIRIESIHHELRARAQRPDQVAAPTVLPAAAPEREMVLSVNGLSKRFGDRHTGELLAVDDVSLGLQSGETLGIVGGSGSGKTTLARCIVGLERATHGRLEILGDEFADWDSLTSRQRNLLRKRIQYVFQDPYSSLNPKLTIGSALAEAAAVAGHADIENEVERLLDLVQLPSSYNRRKPAALSGGERQRVAIARALAVKPHVIICDEVVSALDVSVQAQVLNLLREIQEQLGVAYLFISHDLAVVRHMADRICVMRNGQIVERGTVQAVLEAPSSEYTKTLLASMPGKWAPSGTSRSDLANGAVTSGQHV
jgi:peptide/nickel transport system ATP-binding protein